MEKLSLQLGLWGLCIVVVLGSFKEGVPQKDVKMILCMLRIIHVHPSINPVSILLSFLFFI